MNLQWKQSFLWGANNNDCESPWGGKIRQSGQKIVSIADFSETESVETYGIDGFGSAFSLFLAKKSISLFLHLFSFFGGQTLACVPLELHSS